jgi:hypothetical protein
LLVLLWLADTPSDGGTCCTPCARTEHGAIAPARRLANGSTRGATYGRTDHGTVLTPALRTDRCTGCAANGAADDRTLAPAHRLSQYRTCHGAGTTAKQGSEVVGMCRCTQCSQSDDTAGNQDRERIAGSCGTHEEFRHGWRVGLGPYRQTWRFVIN